MRGLNRRSFSKRERRAMRLDNCLAISAENFWTELQTISSDVFTICQACLRLVDYFQRLCHGVSLIIENFDLNFARGS